MSVGDIYEMDGVRYIIGLDHPNDPIRSACSKQLEQGEYKLLRQPTAPIYQKISEAIRTLDTDSGVGRVASGAKWVSDEIWGDSVPTMGEEG